MRFLWILIVASASPVAAQTVVTEFAPAANTTPRIWFESFVKVAGTASIEHLSGKYGNLEYNQPLPPGGALLQTTADDNDWASVGVFDSYGAIGDVMPTLRIDYSWHKATNGSQNLAAAPSLKLTVSRSPCDDPTGPEGCKGTLVYEPAWNGPWPTAAGPIDGEPPLDTWTTTSIDAYNGRFWWTGGFGQPNTTGGPPLRTLAEWLTVMSSEFAGADLDLIEIGVGSFNRNQRGYFDNVSITHGFGEGYSESYDFEPARSPAVSNDTPEMLLSDQAAAVVQVR